MIRKQAEERTETVSDTVRRTEVEVEDERGRVTGGTTTTSDRKVIRLPYPRSGEPVSAHSCAPTLRPRRLTRQ